MNICDNKYDIITILWESPHLRSQNLEGWVFTKLRQQIRVRQFNKIPFASARLDEQLRDKTPPKQLGM